MSDWDEAAQRELQNERDLAAYGLCHCGSQLRRTVIPGTETYGNPEGSSVISCENGHGLPEGLQP